MLGVKGSWLVDRGSRFCERNDMDQLSRVLELPIVEDHLALRRGLKLLLANAGFRSARAAGAGSGER